MSDSTTVSERCNRDTSDKDWAFVRGLLADLQADEDRQELACLLGMWRLSLRAFRRIEDKRMSLPTPTEVDYLFHKAFTTELISFGTLMIIAAKQHDPEELLAVRVNIEVIEALVQGLHNSFDEWHAQIVPHNIIDLQKRIFDGTPSEDSKAARS